MFKTVARYEEEGLGFPYPVILIDSAEAETAEDGTVIGISVPNLEGLAAAVAVSRALHPWQLAGEEVRALRHILDLSGRAMAQALDMDHTTLSRWENGRQTVGAWADKQVRLITLLALHDRVPGLNADPKDALSLKVVARPPGAWPVFHMHRVAIATGEPGLPAWDSVNLAA
jgi:DNA-binding transcriptional regulator YiaG